MTSIHPDDRRHLEGLLAHQGMDDLDSVIAVAPDRLLDEVSLWSQLPQITFMIDRPVVEQDRVFVGFALEHLDRILDHAASSGTEDYSALLSFADWDYMCEGDPVSPRFLLTHPSRGFFEQVTTTATVSLPARYVTELVGHPERYEIRETLADDGDVERVFVRRRDQPELGH